MSTTTITVPCCVGDKFWIIAYSNREVVQVECTGYYISRDTHLNKDEAYVWVDSLSKRNDYWKIPFGEFEIQCFKTKREAERHL